MDDMDLIDGLERRDHWLTQTAKPHDPETEALRRIMDVHAVHLVHLVHSKFRASEAGGKNRICVRDCSSVA